MPISINTNYTQGIKRQLVTALEPMFHEDDFPIPELKDHTFVGLEYPFTRVEYPAVYITYQEDQLRNGGVGHYEVIVDSNGDTQYVDHWYFTGRINFNIMALSPKERDLLASTLVNILAFGKANNFLDQFRTKVFNSQYIALQYLQDIIHPGGEQMGDTPWNSEVENVFGTSYSIDLLGEFYSDPYSNELVQWEYVQVHPYDPAHGGTPIF